MKKWLLVFCLLLALPVIPVLAQEDVCLDLGGTFDGVTNVCSFANGLTITIDYPAEFAAYPASVMTVIDQFLEEQQVAIYNAAAADPTPPGPYFLGIETDIDAYNSRVRSILFTISDYTGGAHPNLYYRTFTFNQSTGEFIDLEDLFMSGSDPLATIFPMVQADLLAQMGVGADEAWIITGTGTTWNNYASFVLTADSLIFYFPPYQVAPYAAGPFNVEIPLADIRAIFRPPYMKG